MTPRMTLPLPRDKHDTQHAQALIALPWDDIAPAMPQILEWVQDANWPVAAVLLPYLAGMGQRLAPDVKTVLAGDGEQWKYFILQGIVRHSPGLAAALNGELTRFALTPTPGEVEEGVAEMARAILGISKDF